MADGPPGNLDSNRARLYALLALVLARPPGEEVLALVGGLQAGPGVLGAALGQLGAAARAEIADPQRLRREYDRLFIGLSRGEVVPYASWYRTGFLQDRPLMAVRADLAALGLAKATTVPEPEDHVAALLDAMGLLIEAGSEDQRPFFGKHLEPFAERFFLDLEAAAGGGFYTAVGVLGRALIAVETEAFALA